MKQIKDALIFRGGPGPPRSTKQLIQRLASGESVSALLRSAGPFVVTRDAYRQTAEQTRSFTGGVTREGLLQSRCEQRSNRGRRLADHIVDARLCNEGERSAKAFGALIGRALRALPDGCDLIPILIALQ
jgi:hypothetical protein